MRVFFEEPVLSIRELAERAHLTVHTALDDLQQRNIVMELSGKQKGRIYGCRPVLNVIFGLNTDGSKEADDEAVRDPVPTTIVAS